MKHKTFVKLGLMVLIIHVLFVLFYGINKHGFHEDEYYTYFTSTSTGAIIPGETPYETSGYGMQSRFFVSGTERFNFDAVIQHQEEDVHPPLYYLSLNFLMSLLPDRFYKWFGIGLNAIYSLISCIGAMFFFYHLDGSKQREKLAIVCGVTYAIWPSVISSVMLTRMYAMSAMLTILYADVFVILMQSRSMSKRKFAVITMCGALVCYFSFLTHYFCLYMAFLMTLGYCIYTMLTRKDLIRMLIYGSAQVIAIGLAVLTYPASIEHIFAGYRGEDAVSGLFSGDIFSHIKAFWPIINKNFFANLMIPVLVVFGVALVFGGIFVFKCKKSGQAVCADRVAAVCISVVAGVVSVWLVSRTALYLGDASSRYFYPVTSLLIPLMTYCVCKVGLIFGGEEKRVLFVVLAVITMIPAIVGLVRGNVLFLYPEKKEAVAFSQENSNVPVVIIYNESASHRAWYMANEIWPYEQVVYLVNQGSETAMDSKILQTSEKLVVYMACGEDVLEMMIAQNDNLTSYTLMRTDTFFNLYVLE